MLLTCKYLRINEWYLIGSLILDSFMVLSSNPKFGCFSFLFLFYLRKIQITSLYLAQTTLNYNPN